MKEDYTKGLKLSKSNKRRTSKETEELYVIINKAAILAKDRNHPYYKQSVEFLLKAFSPLISNLAYKVHKKVSDIEEYDDVKQEVSYYFVILIENFDNTKSQFAYYISKVLYQYMSKWVKKENQYLHAMTPLTIKEIYIADPKWDNNDSVMQYLNNSILNKDYIEFMEKKALEKSKSTTNYEICTNYFLGDASCSDIAKKLNISYHAVYQKIGDIKEDIADFFETNPYSHGEKTSTGWVICKR